MSYTPNTWAAGDTITAAKLNRIEQGIVGAESSSSSSGGWDAVIRLTHANNSGGDIPTNLTPSIVSGTFAELESIFQSGHRPPRVLVEYVHPWGSMSVMPVGWINYGSGSTMNLTIAGYFDEYINGQFKVIGILTWGANDTLTWKDMLS